MTEDLSNLRPRQPSLYRLAADGRSLDFLFAPCPNCAGLNFPANAPGCRHCGAPLTDVQPVARPGGGVLLEYVTLHAALTPGMSVPRIAGDIRIAEQVVEEGVIAVDDDSTLCPGMPMRAVALPLPSGEFFDCGFVPAEVTP